MRRNRVKAALKAGQAQVGTWLSLGSPFAARYMAQVGFDWLNVDLGIDVAALRNRTQSACAGNSNSP